ncbi:MAG: hypothetical protein WDA71_00585 [Actinomycetota bacterium]
MPSARSAGREALARGLARLEGQPRPRRTDQPAPLRALRAWLNLALAGAVLGSVIGLLNLSENQGAGAFLLVGALVGGLVSIGPILYSIRVLGRGGRAAYPALVATCVLTAQVFLFSGAFAAVPLTLVLLVNHRKVRAYLAGLSQGA